MLDDARWVPFVSDCFRFRHPPDATLQVLNGPPLPEGAARIFLGGPTIRDPHGGKTPAYNMTMFTYQPSADASLEHNVANGVFLPAGSDVVFQAGQHQGQAVTWMMLGSTRTGMIARIRGRAVIVRWHAQSADSPLDQILESLTFTE